MTECNDYRIAGSVTVDAEHFI